MAGPSSTSTDDADAPASTIAASIRSAIPPAAPRRPACTAAITAADGSPASIGTQSATSTPRARPAAPVTIPSVSKSSAGAGPVVTDARAAGRSPLSTLVTSVPCTCRIHTTDPGGRPAARASLALLAATAAGESPTPPPRLNESYGAADTPPRLVVTMRRIRRGARPPDTDAITPEPADPRVETGSGVMAP